MKEKKKMCRKVTAFQTPKTVRTIGPYFVVMVRISDPDLTEEWFEPTGVTTKSIHSNLYSAKTALEILRRDSDYPDNYVIGKVDLVWEKV